jgi:hypothetical protein
MTTLRISRKRLATIWFSGSGLLFSCVLLQTFLGTYSDKAGDAWQWLLPTVLPTLSLMVGILVSGGLGLSDDAKSVDPFMYRLTAVLSLAYLLTVALTILLSPFATWSSPLGLMKMSHFWLAPFQGVVSGALGLFFVSKEHAAGSADPQKEGLRQG